MPFPTPQALPAAQTLSDQHLRLKREIHRQLIAAMERRSVDQFDEREVRRELARGVEELCAYRRELLSQTDRERLISDVLSEALGFGPIDPLLRDQSVSDILINGPRQVYVERHGRLEQTAIVFNDEEHLLEIVRRIAARVGRRIDESSPMVDARLPDGSRVNAVIRPLALDGALVSIRRFPSDPLRSADLVARGALAGEMMEFLAACVHSRLNILVSGGTGSGKTTLLNVLSGFIPAGERVATIEDAAELRLQQHHVARLESRHANAEGQGAVTIRDLVRNALRMRPDRIIIGECRGDEALDMLQAMNTGHAGSFTTLHANDARDALDRLEMLVGMAGLEIPLWLIQRQIAVSINLIVHCARLEGGERKIVRISEVTGLDKGTIGVQDLFRFDQVGLDDAGKPRGAFVATGAVPKCISRLQASGRGLSPDAFARRVLSPGTRQLPEGGRQ